MKFLLMPAGTQGDHQPFGLLADALVEAGHEVSISIKESDSRYSKNQKVGYLISSVSAQEIKNASKALESERRQENVYIKRLRLLFNYVFPPAAQLSDEKIRQNKAFLDLFEGRDAIVCHPMRIPQVSAVCEFSGLKYFVLSPQPILPTRSHAPFAFPQIKISAYNSAAHYFTNFIIWRKNRYWLDNFRIGTLGLPKLSFRDSLKKAGEAKKYFIIVSSVIYKKPSDWPVHAHITGALRIADNRALPVEVEEIAQNDFFVFTCGSKKIVNTDIFLKLLEKVCDQSKMRCIWVLGGTDVGTQRKSDSVHIVKSINYQKILPLSKGFFHHCGIGTLTEAVCANINSIAVPYSAETRFWAKNALKSGLIDFVLDFHGINAGSIEKTSRILSEKLLKPSPNVLNVKNAARQISAEKPLSSIVAELTAS